MQVKKSKNYAQQRLKFPLKDPMADIYRKARKGVVATVVAASLLMSSVAMALSPGYVQRIFNANGIPPQAISYSYYQNLNQYGARSAASIIRFFKDAYCDISMDTSGTAKEVGMRFLTWAAKQKGVDLSWFDPVFLDRLATKVGEELKGGKTKIVLADLGKGL